MEQINYYIGISWKYKLFMLIVILLLVSITGVVTLLIPPAYTATTKIKITPVASVAIPGFISSSSDDMVDFDTYSSLVTDQNFKNEVIVFARTKSNDPALEKMRQNSLRISVEGLQKTNLMTLSVDATTGKSAQVLANAAADILIKRAEEFMFGSNDHIRSFLTKQIKHSDTKLAEMRRLTHELNAELALINRQTTQQANTYIDQSIKVKKLDDEIHATENLRQTYSDYLAKLSLGESMQETALQVVYPAIAPAEPSNPSLAKNLLVSLLVGLLLGAGVPILFDYIHKAKEMGLAGTLDKNNQQKRQQN